MAEEAQIIERVELLVSDVRTLSEDLRGLTEVIRESNMFRGSDRQSVHGALVTGAAVTASVACVFLMVAFLIIENRSYSNMARQMSDFKVHQDLETSDLKAHYDAQIDQLRAWNDVNRGKIAVLEAKPK